MAPSVLAYDTSLEHRRDQEVDGSIVA